MKKPIFIPISSVDPNLFKNKKNLDLADPSKKNSYFDRNDKTFHIKFPVPNKDFEIYYVTNNTRRDSVMPVITIFISDKTPNKTKTKPKTHIAYIKFKYDEIIPYPGIDFDLNKTTEIKVIVFNDESVASKRNTPIFNFKFKGMVGHFYEINASNIAELSNFKLDKKISDQLDIAELSDYELYGARVNDNNIIEVFGSRPREVGGGVIVGG